MSEKTAVEQFAAEVLKYKNPTNLNGTDYIMISINKVEYLKEKFKEVEKEQTINAHLEGQCDETEGYPLEIAKKFYNETYGDNK